MRAALLLLAMGCQDYGFSVKSTTGGGSTGEPFIEVEPLALDFWEASLGETVELSFVVRSVGTAPLTVQEITLGSGVDFALLDTADLLSLKPGEEADFRVSFSPTAAGELGDLATVYSNDADQPAVDVTLSGTGLVPWLEITPAEHDFGAIAVPCEDAVELTLQNVGTDDLVLTDVVMTGDEQLAIREAPELPRSLAPGAYTTVWVDLLPATEGAVEGALQVSSNDPRGVLEAPLSATLSYGPSASDTFSVPTDPPVDILFAVDQSGSMDDDAEALAANFGAFIDALEARTEGWQVGVVTYDGGCLNEGVLDADTAGAAALFTAAVAEGEDGDIEDDEALFQILDRALSQTDADGCNAGLLREGAPLHVIVVSDEPERSTEEASAWSWDWFLDRYQDYVESASLLLLSGVVDRDGCNEGADGYAQMIEATGGELLSICDSDWSDDALALAEASTTYLYTFTLSETAVESSIVVTLDGEPASAGWRYDAAGNAVILEDPPLGAVVVVDYAVASSCP